MLYEANTAMTKKGPETLSILCSFEDNGGMMIYKTSLVLSLTNNTQFNRKERDAPLMTAVTHL